MKRQLPRIRGSVTRRIGRKFSNAPDSRKSNLSVSAPLLAAQALPDSAIGTASRLWQLLGMSTLTLELQATLRELDPESATKLERLVRGCARIGDSGDHAVTFIFDLRWRLAR